MPTLLVKTGRAFLASARKTRSVFLPLKPAHVFASALPPALPPCAASEQRDDGIRTGDATRTTKEKTSQPIYWRGVFVSAVPFRV